MNLQIANIGIKQDDQGRYCLNDLHRAAGGEKKHQPSNWLRLETTQLLSEEITNSSDVRNTAISALSGNQGGTFVCKEMVYAYAMWISPAFHLKVIRAYDAMMQPQTPIIPQTLSEALRLAADLADKVTVLAPKAEALDKIALADGTLSLSDAAKTIGVQPQKEFIPRLQKEKWIFRRAGGDHWIAYQDKLQQMLLEHKVTTVSRGDGSEKITEQVRVTPKGLTKLAQMFTGGQHA